MSALHDLTVAQLAAKLKAREVSAVEAAQHFLARSRQHADLGAYLAQDDAVTLAQAQAADARLAAGDAPLLAGVPIAHKDIFVTTDFPTTAGSKMLAGYRSPFESTVTSLFQRQTGESFGRWRQRIRLHHARAQLEAGESVTAVALNCGYASVSAFIAAFKKLFGRTPGQLAR